MNRAHTPGPWEVKADAGLRTYIRILGTRLGGRRVVAHAMNPAYPGAHPCEFVETLANAHLIAAAPALLKALDGMVAIFALNFEPGASPTVDDARAAIVAAAGSAQ